MPFPADGAYPRIARVLRPGPLNGHVQQKRPGRLRPGRLAGGHGAAFQPAARGLGCARVQHRGQRVNVPVAGAVLGHEQQVHVAAVRPPAPKHRGPMQVGGPQPSAQGAAGPVGHQPGVGQNLVRRLRGRGHGCDYPRPCGPVPYPPGTQAPRESGGPDYVPCVT